MLLVRAATFYLLYEESLDDWIIGTVASLAAFGINYHADVAECPTAVYIVFLCLMSSGILVAFFGIVQPSSVRRADGTALAHYPHNGAWVEFKAQAELFKDWRLLALVIPLFASEVAVIVFSTLNGKSPYLQSLGS